MSQIAMTVVDAERAMHGRPHGSFVDIAVAALSADPETLEELQAALARFTTPERGDDFAGWQPGVCDEPYDAGICVIDLAARLVLIDSTYSTPGPRGYVRVSIPDGHDEWEISYHLADDWRFLGDVCLWPAAADARRGERRLRLPFDARAVLYGPPLWKFLVEQCLAARGGTWADDTWTPPTGWSLWALPERAQEGRPLTPDDAVAEIHARWLMTSREELRGQTPREVLVAERDHLGWELQDRSEQWSLTGQCPQPLSRNSTAFRCGGFGTHENVIYYDLVRELAVYCWERIADASAEPPPAEIHVAEEIGQLKQAQDAWLNEPNDEDFCGQAPAAVIEWERRRIPWAISPREMLVDDDCPLCQMTADGGRPAFWSLDGCSNDYDFPFSFYHRTREEYDDEQRRHEAFTRQFEEERCQRREAAAPDDGDISGDDTPTVWQRSFSQLDADGPPQMMLFGIGSHLSELVEDLRSSTDGLPWAESFNRQFGNLRAAAADESGALLAPVVSRFCDELHAAGDACPDLDPKCADLQRQLHVFLARLTGEPETDDDFLI
jgi:hypothetical protein